eukprot:TRINITY_DN207_c0_g1_i2.p2 TRINITY_DN207_c0_g1~~TRINITY_DN207_c0_g1_i2.p2  ORF type:complete len:257 (+),score=8.01 TRINITY_DN207_c0_g1_i2:1873-2643(+)
MKSGKGTTGRSGNTGKGNNRLEELVVNHRAEARDDNLLQIRTAADDSSSLRNEPMWMGLPLLNPAHLPLAQTGLHLLQQGYNRVLDWLQGTGTDEGIQFQELLPHEQTAGFLQGYNKISQELDGIFQQLESDPTIASSLLSWLKNSFVEHRAQGQQLVLQQMVTQASIKAYLQNIQTVAKDVTELVEDLLADNSNSAVSYAQVRLAEMNQSLAKLSENPAVIAKDHFNSSCKNSIANAVHQQPMNVMWPQSLLATN